MTAKQIAKTLKDKGFDTKVSGDFVTVSLKRAISTMEVEAALDYEAPILGKSGKSVVVMGTQEMTKKYASFIHYPSYLCRLTPFFDTAMEAKKWLEEYYHPDDIWNHYICSRWDWQEIIAGRNSYNCDDGVSLGE